MNNSTQKHHTCMAKAKVVAKYIVRKQYIFGTDDSYTQHLLNIGFDGAYLDIIEGFEYFED